MRLDWAVDWAVFILGKSVEMDSVSDRIFMKRYGERANGETVTVQVNS